MKRLMTNMCVYGHSWCLAYKLWSEDRHVCVWTLLVSDILAVVWEPTCVCMDPVGVWHIRCGLMTYMCVYGPSWCLAYYLWSDDLHVCVWTQLVSSILAVVWWPTCVCMDPVGVWHIRCGQRTYMCVYGPSWCLHIRCGLMTYILYMCVYGPSWCLAY
jgi:hypothetical protein